jgi:TM2 domain-containing membrane protein YozV
MKMTKNNKRGRKRKPETYTAPAIVSAFFPGVGQIMKKDVAKGVLMMFSYFMACLSCLILIGFFIVPVLWIWIIYDAYNTPAIEG